MSDFPYSYYNVKRDNKYWTGGDHAQAWSFDQEKAAVLREPMAFCVIRAFRCSGLSGNFYTVSVDFKDGL